jgi:hypothetical protein
MVERRQDVLGARQDSMWPLFAAGHNVITQLRTVTPEFGT